jgi:hypothetical protein
MTARARLFMLLAGASWLLILIWILRPGSSGLPEAPLLRIVLALLLAGLNTWIALPGPPRRAVAGWFFATVLCNIVVQYGEMVGLRPIWQRGLVGLVVSSPFIYLIFTSDRKEGQGPPGRTSSEDSE